MPRDSPLTRLTSLFAVVTLPLGILAAVFAGLSAAAVVFVVGWLLLTPVSAVLFGSPGPSQSDEIQDLVEAQIKAEFSDTLDDTTGDPVEKLRERYARGEIDERELERRLDALLEMEDIENAADSERIERVIDGLDTGRPPETEPAAGSDRREPAYDREGER